MLQGRKLLLADDSIAIQKVIELTFEDEGMQVVSVGDGRQAVERLEEVRPDVVLADVFMPELNGYQLCEQIKNNEQFRHVPVILLVGSFEPFNEAEARRVGADDYLTKPFQSIRQMVSKVSSLLSGRKDEAEDETATQQLPARPGPVKSESQARLDNLELTTADTAPLPPQAQPEAQAAGNAPPARHFADMQLDDEMIEETPASVFSSPEQTMAGSQPRPASSFPAQDVSETGGKPAATATNQQPAAESAGISASEARDEGRVVEPPPAPAVNAARSAASDDSLLDLEDVEMPHTSAMAEADDFILDLQDSEEARPQSTKPAEVIPPAKEAEAEVDLTEEVMEAAPSAAESVAAEGAQPTMAEAAPEIQPAADTSQMQETHELPSEPQLAPPSELPEGIQPEAPPQVEAAAVPATAPVSETPPQPGQLGLGQLSPEVIDAIARRVVEQLSTPVIEQIAWEVVPQLAELLIKRRLEEEGKK